MHALLLLICCYLSVVAAYSHQGAAASADGRFTSLLQDPSNGKASALLSCLPQSCQGKRTWWDHLANHVPPCLTAQQIWWSRIKPRLPITLVTQLSINRLPVLRAQCQAWAGPLAAAIYVPLLSPGPTEPTALSPVNQQRLDAAIHAVGQLMSWAEETALATEGVSEQLARGWNAEGLQADTDTDSTQRPRATCQLRMILLYEVLGQEKAVALYPVNSLRNYARLLADTPLITNIDVDMLPSFSLSAALLQGWPPAAGTDTAAAAAAAATSQAYLPGSAGDLLQRVQQEKAVFVLPAFETTCGGPRFSDQVSGFTKPQILEKIDMNCTSIFRYQVAPQCHNSTNFPRWFELPSSIDQSTVPYHVQYEDSFEPWFIGARANTEWFDVRYRGYGKNKIQQVAHTAHHHAVFYVHPTGFIVHRPHDQSQARKVFLRVKFKSRHNIQLLQDSLYQHVEGMWTQHFEEIKAGTFQAVVDDAVVNCLQQLDWWQPGYQHAP